MSHITIPQLPPLLVPEHADDCLMRMRLHLERARLLEAPNAKGVAYNLVITGASFQLWWNPQLTTEQRDALVALRSLADREWKAFQEQLREVEPWK